MCHKELMETVPITRCKPEVDHMEEWEALIKRRRMLLERISKMNYEVEKIDKRLDFLGRITMSEQYHVLERLVQEVS